MKKSLKSTVLAIALMVSVTGAFATSYANSSKAQDPTYNWTRFDRNGNPLPPLFNKTKAEAIGITGCNSTLAVCAVASGGPTLRYN
ncbi:hypothetical protein [Pedobacter sp. WC2423]|uniref:hypothetical protein n=1 Tax=Pedobacter sp. WC2423 TaxID=3234142 RepID=UPI0034663283